MIRLLIIAVCFLLAPLTVLAQAVGTPYTFTGDDIYRTMTPSDQTELQRIQDELRELQKLGRSKAKGSLERRAILNEFERVKAEREEKFGYIRGINGTTITFWGEPVPAPEDILRDVLMARKGELGDGMLYPHYYYDQDARIRGAAAPPPHATAPAKAPSGSTSEGSGIDFGASGLVVSDDAVSALECEGEDCGCDESTYAFGTSVYECDDD